MITSLFGALQTLNRRNDDDAIDRAHYFITSNLLIMLSILVSYKQFGGGPIECMLPSKFPGQWEDYAENFCWAQDTYFVEPEEQVKFEREKTMREGRISYYQWVPFFLLIEAACFRLPSLIWKYLAAHSGIKIHDIVKLAVDEKNVEPECKKANIKSLTIHLQNALRFHRRLYKKKITPHRLLRFLNLPYTAFFVTTMYLLTKLLYLVNVCLQLFFLNKFLGVENGWHGFNAIYAILNGTTWEHTGLFPRVTICDFDVRVHGNLQTFSVQCVLVINIFNEKIFIFLWFWYIILVLLTALSCLYWVLVTTVPVFSRWFISRHLELSEMPFDPRGSRKDVERFVCSYLKTDGVFVVRMITMHSGIIFGTDLVLALWKSFYGIEEVIRRSASDDQTPTPAAIWAPTPPINPCAANDGKLEQLLRLRKKSSSSEEAQERARAKAKELEDDLAERLLPASLRDTEAVETPTAPGLDIPDSAATTMEIHRMNSENAVNEDSAGRGGAAAAPGKQRSLRIKIPSQDEDYTTARSTGGGSTKV